ncbi:unnamed protein product [Porites lobata]|uniref:Non-specific serine/threonine protein kinase n=1 Tax=Porites lobata TaxID=104759 RepID=A0ABN8PEW0_9CNID|nr:unnamed protein product [Porites lobata]
MVNFYHDLGIIIEHRSTVILSTQWLIDLFGQLITIPDFTKMAGPTQPPTLYQNGAWFVIEKKTVHDFFLFLRSSLLSSLSSKESTLSRSVWMRQVRWQCRFVSLWRQLCKLCHVISIKVDCSIIFGSPVRIVSGKNTQAIIRLHVLMKIVFTSLR